MQRSRVGPLSIVGKQIFILWLLQARLTGTNSLLKPTSNNKNTKVKFQNKNTGDAKLYRLNNDSVEFQRKFCWLETFDGQVYDLKLPLLTKVCDIFSASKCGSKTWRHPTVISSPQNGASLYSWPTWHFSSTKAYLSLLPGQICRSKMSKIIWIVHSA